MSEIDLLNPVIPTVEQMEKLLDEMMNYVDEGLTSEEFEKKYPRKHTPYELQRLDFQKAKKALQEANVPPPYKVIIAP